VDILGHVLNAEKYKIEYKVVNKIQNIDTIKNKIKGIIITGSSMKLSKGVEFNKYSFNIYYISKLNVPIYGICFGCQLLNIIYGGELKNNKKYICGDYIFYKYKSDTPLLKGIKGDYFRYCFSDIVIPNKKIDIKVFSSIIINGKIIDTFFEFEKNRVWGSLFHPESSPSRSRNSKECNDDPDKIFFNFYELCKTYNQY
jgi:anthranilate/para-aminobenzoate synthase component II